MSELKRREVVVVVEGYVAFEAIRRVVKFEEEFKCVKYCFVDVEMVFVDSELVVKVL